MLLYALAAVDVEGLAQGTGVPVTRAELKRNAPRNLHPIVQEGLGV
jgi:hypothetical protein